MITDFVDDVSKTAKIYLLYVEDEDKGNVLFYITCREVDALSTAQHTEKQTGRKVFIKHYWTGRGSSLRETRYVRKDGQVEIFYAIEPIL